MFRLFEKALNPTEPPAQSQPPAGLIAFYWHFARQAKGLFAALFVAGLVVALLDSTIPVFMGRIVTLVTSSQPETLWTENWPMLLGMAFVLLLLRPLAQMAQNLVSNQAIAVNVANMIRWQNHFHVARQSWAFFQNDFAGRIANRVMQTGPAVRESLVALITGVWYILVYGTAALILLASADRWLALPIVLWFVSYIVMLRIFVPRMRDRSKEVSEARSWLVGRIVDTYTNILTVKLFARARDEDAYVREAFEEHTGLFYNSLRLNTLFSFSLSTLNAMLVTGTGGMAIWLWMHGKVEVGTVAMALPLSWQIINIAGWVAMRVTEIFENIGVVQEGMMTIARPIALTDKPDAGALAVPRGEIEFKDIRFGYGRESGLIDGLSLVIHPGERIGLIGRSGAGKSTLVNLMLRFFDLEDGAILIDGQDIAQDHAGEPAHADLRGDAGHLAAAPLDPRQHPLRQARRHRRRDRRGGEAGAGPRLHPRTGRLARPARLRRPCRRARRQAFRRPAPAHRHRPRDPEERADPGARRGHLLARQRGRGRDPGEPRHADGRQDRDRHRAPALDHRADGPPRRDRPRPHRRAGHARRTAAHRRALRRAVAAAVRRLHRFRAAGAGGGINKPDRGE